MKILNNFVTDRDLDSEPESRIDAAESRLYGLYKCENKSLCESVSIVVDEFNLDDNEIEYMRYQATGW